MKNLSLSGLKVKLKSGKLKTRKRRKRRNLFSEFFSSKFSILTIRPKSKSRKRKSRKNISEISDGSTKLICSEVKETHNKANTWWQSFSQLNLNTFPHDQLNDHTKKFSLVNRPNPVNWASSPNVIRP